MAKADKIHEARMQGMYYAMTQIEKNGLEAFKEELSFRQAFGVTLFNSQKELKEYADTIINRSMQVILVFAVAVLHDEFGFGKKRAERFIERFNLKASCLTEDYITWDEQVKIIKDEMDIEVTFK